MMDHTCSVFRVHECSAQELQLLKYSQHEHSGAGCEENERGDLPNAGTHRSHVMRCACRELEGRCPGPRLL